VSRQWLAQAADQVNIWPAWHCKENDDLEKAVKEMADKKTRRMVVTDDSDKLTGILSLDDVAGHARSEQLKNDILRGIAR
jgi:CBS domain-containing protein